MYSLVFFYQKGVDPMDAQTEAERAAWLNARTAELAANGHAQQRLEREKFQRRETELFLQRQRRDDATMRLAGFVLIVVLVCIVLLVITLLPALWDMFWQHWHQLPGLLAVVAAPAVRMPFVTSICCRHCGADLPVMPPTRFSAQLLAEVSERCSCQLQSAPIAPGIFRALLQEVVAQSERSPRPNAAAQQSARDLAASGTEAQCREALRSLLERSDRLVDAGAWKRTGTSAELTERVRAALAGSGKEVNDRV